jgi:hypothetical protein
MCWLLFAFCVALIYRAGFVLVVRGEEAVLLFLHVTKVLTPTDDLLQRRNA